jgi:transcriptional regulator CtsR
MATSDIIAKFIGDILSESDGSAELRRNDLALRFNCVPSQINYVIATRFSPEHGYIVESRRGGGGFIRITRVKLDPERIMMHTVNTIGDSIDFKTAAALVGNLLHHGVLSEIEARLILAAVGDNALRALNVQARCELRASIMKQMLINAI